MQPITSRTLLRALTRPGQCDTRRLRAVSSLAAVALARGRPPVAACAPGAARVSDAVDGEGAARGEGDAGAGPRAAASPTR
jgi:hypothetical protein